MINLLKNFDFVSTDQKVRKHIQPKKILAVGGDVQKSENLLIQKENQVYTYEPLSAIFKNGFDGEHAYVLLDFGAEFSGGAKIITELCIGETYPSVRLTFGESAGEAMSEIGEKGAKNDHSTRDMTVTLSCFSDMEFAQTGYRFLKLELLSKDSEIHIKSILGVFTYRDIEYKGSFECSDKKLNDIYNVAAYTCHLNMQDMLWDGIKRDRLVWIGDMHPEMLTIKTVFGDDSCIEEGLAYSVLKSPLPNYPNGMVTYAMWWLIICRDWYMCTGNTDFIFSHKEYISSLLKQLCALVDDNGTDSLSQYDTGYFLDWPTFGKEEAKPGVRALFSLALSAGSELTKILNNEELSLECVEKIEALKGNVSENRDAKVSVAFMTLAEHISEENALPFLLSDGAKGMSTFMSYYILSAMSKAGKTNEALKILREYYGAMLDAGATTFWEDFSLDWVREGAKLDSLDKEYDIHGDNGAHCYIGFRHSLCHGWSSAPTAFLAEQVLGIKITKPGFKAVKIEPELGELTYARGTYPTPYGIISVSHTKKSDGSISSDISLPEGIELEK